MATFEEKVQQRAGGVSTLTGGVRTSQNAVAQAAQSTIKQKVQIQRRNNDPGFFTNVGNSLQNTASAAPGLAAEFGKGLFSGAVGLGNQLSDTVSGELYNQIGREQKLNDSRGVLMEALTKRHKAGKLSTERYKELVNEITKESKDSTEKLKATATRADRGDVLKNAASTLLLIMSAGRYQGTKTVAATTAARGFFGRSFTAKILSSKAGPALINLEKAAARIPAVRDLIVRNGAKLGKTGSIAKESLKDAAVGALIKQPFIYHQNVEDISSIIDDLEDKKIGGAIGTSLWIASQGIGGGLFGASIKKTQQGGKKLSELTYGAGSLGDLVSASLKGGDARNFKRYMDALEKNDPKKFKEVERALRAWQAANLDRWGSAEVAAAQIEEFIRRNHGVEMSTMRVDDFINANYLQWKYAEEVDKVAATGKLTNLDGIELLPGTAAIGRFDRGSREALISSLEGLTKAQQLKYLDHLRNDTGVFWAQNDALFNKIKKIVAEGEDVESIARKIKNIDTATTVEGVSKNLATRMAKDGFVVIVPKNNLMKVADYDATPKLISKFASKGTEYFDPEVLPNPTLNFMSSVIKKAGFSPQQANEIAYKQLRQAVTTELSLTGAAAELSMGRFKGRNAEEVGGIILKTLQNYADTKAAAFNLPTKNAITDIRQLRIGEIVEALGISKKSAKEVANSIIEGYIRVPLEARGMGDRIVDRLFQVPLYAKYNRAQSALRYSYNPFFRFQEIVETKVLSQMQHGNMVWGKTFGALDDTVEKLAKLNIFDTGFSGKGARDDVVLGRLTDNITKTQKRDLAGLAEALAKKRGMTFDEYAINHFDELEDTLKVVVQYPTKGALNSPLARTLNLAFFPMRYNIKIAGMTAKFVAKQPPAIQAAILKGSLEATDWLKSDEGIAWESENYELINLLKWATPVGSLTSIVNLLNGRVDSISDLGVLGGIPLGFVSQIVEGQGLFQNLPAGLQYETPYMNPKTGEVYPEKIPEGAGARMTTGLIDFLSASFTYPGRIVGLPGKTQGIRDFAEFLTQQRGNEGFKFVDQTDQLTELQKRKVEILKKGIITDEDIIELYTSPSGGFEIPDFDAFIVPDLQPIGIKERDVPDDVKKGKKGKKAKTERIKTAPKEITDLFN